MNSLIRFKGYEFEHNPETLRITTQKNISQQNVIGAKSVVSEIGDNSRTIIGEGKIHGENCIYKYIKLFKLKEQSGSGVLSLPGIKPFYAFFQSLEFSADPTPELITYKFVFRENSSKNRNSLVPEKYYTVQNGEDLWDISYKFNVPIETLTELNPDIKRANEIEEGRVVKIC
ncbi:MAG: LysM peptidoglycan-binding domain-containing protein [Ruminococcus sp.]|nr:LysM peptidoglycan-binding domain-containing protein [Ruminococcus sp.]